MIILYSTVLPYCILLDCKPVVLYCSAMFCNYHRTRKTHCMVVLGAVLYMSADSYRERMSSGKHIKPSRRARESARAHSTGGKAISKHDARAHHVFELVFGHTRGV